MLAAVIANPVSYDPTLHPEAALERRSVALDRLVATGKITRDQAYLYDHTPLPVRRCGVDVLVKPVSCGDAAVPQTGDYFTEEVKQQLLDDPRLGATKEERTAALFGGGLKIYTTLDPVAQLAAEQARDENLPANDKGITAALVSVEPSTGAVRALVGGPGFGQVKYDIATQTPDARPGRRSRCSTCSPPCSRATCPSTSSGAAARSPTRAAARTPTSSPARAAR